jgi:hypothetical protein
MYVVVGQGMKWLLRLRRAGIRGKFALRRWTIVAVCSCMRAGHVCSSRAGHVCSRQVRAEKLDGCRGM